MTLIEILITLVLQVESGEIKVTEITPEQNTVVLEHNCSAQLKYIAQLALAMYCPGNTECGDVEYCWEGESLTCA